MTYPDDVLCRSTLLNTLYQHTLSTLSVNTINPPFQSLYQIILSFPHEPRWDLACVLDLANGHGSTFTPEEKKRMGDFDVSNYRGVSGGGAGGGTGSFTKPPVTSGSTKHPGNSSSTSLIGGLATVGGRLMSFDSPESAQQYYQDNNDARFIIASLSGNSILLSLLSDPPSCRTLTFLGHSFSTTLVLVY